MNRIAKQLAVLAMALGACAVHAQSADEPVVVKTQHLPPAVAKRVEAAAAQGIAELRRFVHITRGIHALDLQALIATPEEVAVLRAEAGKVANKVARDQAPRAKTP